MTLDATPRRVSFICVLLIAASRAVVPSPARTEEPRRGDHEQIEPDGIRGSLVLCGGGRLPDAVRDRFLELAGGNAARIVVIPTASGGETAEEDGREVAEIWKAREPAEVTVLHTLSSERADSDEFVEPLRRATGVWISGGRQTQLVAVYSNTLVERELAALVARGGVVGGTSAGAACMSRVMIVRGNIWPTPGFGLVPGAIVDQHFLARGRKSRLFDVLARHPTHVGLGIDEGTALVVQGRSLRCVGDSTVTVCLAAQPGHDAHELELRPGQLSDLTMFRRAAQARTRPAFPPERPAEPEVPGGALVIVGGGGLPAEITQRFIELAGGPESPIVVLPTANPDPLPPRPRDGDFLIRAGAKNVHVLAARRRDEIESAGFLDVLKQARGIWFGGGRQWRFVDAYEGTRAVTAFHDVLRRGGVIGGSSAGATIQGDYLVRGSPLGNEEMMALGYERGFAFLPGTAIDQHFSQRKRFADMTQVMQAHPQLLGIGLDESTAIVVQGRCAEVLGKNKVHFYDRRRPVAEEQAEYLSLGPGEKFDLVAREVVATGE